MKKEGTTYFVELKVQNSSIHAASLQQKQTCCQIDELQDQNYWDKKIRSIAIKGNQEFIV